MFNIDICSISKSVLVSFKQIMSYFKVGHESYFEQTNFQDLELMFWV